MEARKEEDDGRQDYYTGRSDNDRGSVCGANIRVGDRLLLIVPDKVWVR